MIISPLFHTIFAFPALLSPCFHLFCSPFLCSAHTTTHNTRQHTVLQHERGTTPLPSAGPGPLHSKWRAVWELVKAHALWRCVALPLRCGLLLLLQLLAGCPLRFGVGWCWLVCGVFFLYVWCCVVLLCCCVVCVCVFLLVVSRVS